MRLRFTGKPRGEDWAEYASDEFARNPPQLFSRPCPYRSHGCLYTNINRTRVLNHIDRGCDVAQILRDEPNASNDRVQLLRVEPRYQQIAQTQAASTRANTKRQFIGNLQQQLRDLPSFPTSSSTPTRLNITNAHGTLHDSVDDTSYQASLQSATLKLELGQRMLADPIEAPLKKQHPLFRAWSQHVSTLAASQKKWYSDESCPYIDPSGEPCRWVQQNSSAADRLTADLV